MYLEYKAREKHNRRCVVRRYYVLKIRTNEKKCRKPLKQVIHSYQLHLARFRDINFCLMYISQFQNLQIICKRHWRWKTDPSTIAVLPTPSSLMSTWLFFVLKDKICMQCRISSSWPITGSSFLCFAIFVRLIPYFFRASYFLSGSTIATSKEVLLAPKKRKP